MPEPRFPVDYEALAETLTAIGYGARLELLNTLVSPHPLGDIKLAPQRGGAENPDRAMSKQAVQAHLEKLVETGLVRAEYMDVEGREMKCYVANAQRLYALVEDLRGLCARYTAHVPAGDATGTLGSGSAVAAQTGPRLVLVHGVYEGKPFPLVPATAKDGRWIVGRRKDAAVALDYDPFVSGDHAAVTAQGDGFVVSDLPGSKNGTSVNWRQLAKGASHRLAPGDVVAVGRSLLVFVPQ